MRPSRGHFPLLLFLLPPLFLRLLPHPRFTVPLFPDCRGTRPWRERPLCLCSKQLLRSFLRQGEGGCSFVFYHFALLSRRDPSRNARFVCRLQRLRPALQLSDNYKCSRIAPRPLGTPVFGSPLRSRICKGTAKGEATFFTWRGILQNRLTRDANIVADTKWDVSSDFRYFSLDTKFSVKSCTRSWKIE